MFLTLGLLASLVTGIIGAHFGFMLCNDHPAAFLMALAVARWTYLGFKDLQDLADEAIDTPQPKSYALTELEAMATLKETLTYTSLGDRWWHIRDLNLDDGRLLAAVNFDENTFRFADHHGSTEKMRGTTQIVLIAEVSPLAIADNITVRLRFVVTSTYGRSQATTVIKELQAAFDEALSLRIQKKLPLTEVAA